MYLYPNLPWIRGEKKIWKPPAGKKNQWWWMWRWFYSSENLSIAFYWTNLTCTCSQKPSSFDKHLVQKIPPPVSTKPSSADRHTLSTWYEYTYISDIYNIIYIYVSIPRITARLLRLPRLRNRLGNWRRWIKTPNVVSSVLLRVQYKIETPNQSLKLKTLNVVSGVQYKHETPNQSLKLKTLNVACSYVFSGAVEPWTPKPIPKFKTLNVECGMCLKVHWNHATPNQSLNCGTLGKRRRLWVELHICYLISLGSP